MKVLVTGAKGQVGTDVFLEAEKRGHQVLGFTSSELDITDKTAVSRAVSSVMPDVVINAAAYTAVDKAETEQEKAYAVNEAGVKNLADACKEQDVPLLHISTDYVFDGEKKEPYVETDAPNPTSVYGASKLAGEVALQNTWRKHIILRVSWVFGEHGNNFVKTMLRLAEDRDEIAVVNDQFGAPTPAKAIAQCLLDIAEKDHFGEGDFPWGLYHYQSDPGVTWYEFANEIFNRAMSVGLVGETFKVCPINSSEFPVVANRPNNSKLSGSKLRMLHGVKSARWKVGIKPLLVVPVAN